MGEPAPPQSAGAPSSSRAGAVVAPAPPPPSGPLDRLFRLARSASLSAYPLIGSVSGARGAAWLEPAKSTGLFPAPGATDPGHADLLVVVGQLSHKLAPVLQRTHAAMAHPAYVLWLPLVSDDDEARASGYATIANLDRIVPVDVVVTGASPSDEALHEALASLTGRVRRGDRQ